MRNPLSAILQSADGISSAITEARQSSDRQEHTHLDREELEHIIESTQTIVLCAQHQKVRLKFVLYEDPETDTLAEDCG